jgi:hypothetical protein
LEEATDLSQDKVINEFLMTFVSIWGVRVFRKDAKSLFYVRFNGNNCLINEAKYVKFPVWKWNLKHNYKLKITNNNYNHSDYVNM